MTKRGRTWRKRNKRTCCIQNSRPQVLLAADYIRLLKWAKQNGVSFKTMRPAVFQETGRGMLASKKIQTNDCIISVPEKLLISTETVMRSALGKYLRRVLSIKDSKLSVKQVLCLFLLYERYHGKDSFWFSYLETLPKEFNTPCYFSQEEIELLPRSYKRLCIEQVCELKQAYEELQRMSNVIGEFDAHFWSTIDFDGFRWAWFVINTRSVYLSKEKNSTHEYGPGRKEHYALAPVLDLLNHSDQAEMNATFNPDTRRYEIHTTTEYAKGTQVFISYGPHDNTKLLLEYGFILPKNIHNSYKFELPTVLAVAGRTTSSISKAKWEIIQRNGFDKDLTCVEGCGISWKLHALVAILALPESSLSNWDIIFKVNYLSMQHQSQVEKWLRDLLENELEKLNMEAELVKKRSVTFSLTSVSLNMILQLREQEKNLLEEGIQLLL